MARSCLVFLFAVGWLCSGCSLPKGKLSETEKTDADGGIRDSGVSHVKQTDKAPRNAGAGAAGSTMLDASLATATGAAMPTDNSKPKAKAKGERCDSSVECASANCKRGASADKHCYGSLARGRDCNGQYDCDGYTCVPRKHGETQGVCIDTSACAQDGCLQNQALAFCQLDQTCSAAPLDFVKCYESKCVGDSDADAGCAQESVEQHLNEIGCCPPGGASKGSCGTSPQCGCADDMKCDSLRNGGGTACGPVGASTEGGPCLKDAECAKGLTCRGRLCRRFCDGPDDQSCGKGACISAIANDKPEPGIFLCTRSCDPITPMLQSDVYAGCASNQGCQPTENGNSSCYATTGTGMQLASCDDGTGTGGTDGFKCAPGYACMMPGGTCERYCKVQDGACEFGKCYSFGPSKMYAGSVEIGYCE